MSMEGFRVGLGRQHGLFLDSGAAGIEDGGSSRLRVLEFRQERPEKALVSAPSPN
jgi:hypothetical protein